MIKVKCSVYSTQTHLVENWLLRNTLMVKYEIINLDEPNLIKNIFQTTRKN